MKKVILFAVAALMTFTVAAQTNKFAHVNFAELVQLMPEADEARSQMAAAAKEAQDTQQSMIEEFQVKYRQYQEKVESWTPAIRESKEKELADINTRIQEFNQSIQQELQVQEAKLMAPIQKKATEAVTKLAKKGGYIYVFEKTTILYLDESQSDDLTQAARKELGIPADRTLESLQQEIQTKMQARAE